MGVALPETTAEALDTLAAHPGARVLAGGTDLMVEVNGGRSRPSDVVALRRVAELRGWTRSDDSVVLRAGLTYREMAQPALADLVPALAQAARTVGSPQIRNAGTIGGNLATASPAGDTLPVLAALDARVTVRGRNGARTLALDELVTGPKRSQLAADELVTEVRVPVARGPQEFLKVGTRNAMVISVCNVALVVDREARRVGCGLGAVGPVVIRPRDAEAWLAERVDWESGRPDGPGVAEEFGARVAAAASPIDDHRSTAEYRRHAVGVLATRALRRVAGATR